VINLVLAGGPAAEPPEFCNQIGRGRGRAALHRL